MADFNSKYTGEQVDALLDIVSQGGVGGGGGEGEVQKTTEAEITAMGFTKNLGTITEVKMNGVTKGTSGVVDLGTVITAHQDISGKADNTRVDLISERLDDIDSEMKDFATESQLNNKQDVITDLDTIRQGAAKGNTALQKDAFFMWDIPTNDGGDVIMFGKLTEEEYNGFMNSDVVIVNGILAIRDGDMFVISVPSADSLSMLIVNVGVSEEGEYFYLAQIQSTEIPTKTSQLENDRNFVSSDNLRTINGQSIVGSGDIEIAALTVETDPVFSASPAASITEVKKTEWDGKQDAIADLDTIRSGAALGATALQRIDYPQLEDNLIDSGFYHSPDGMLYRSDMEDAVQESLNKADSALQSENDPIFLASPAASITEAKKAEWDNKVDKVDGKQLSTEDFTSALKTKLEGLSNYDDTELSEALSTLRGDFDKLVSGDTTTAIKTFNEVISFLDGITDTQDLESIIASIEQQIAGKYTKPSGGIPASDLAPDVFLQGEKGDKGDKGDTGATGPQGVSVTSVVQTTTSSADGGSNVMTVTLSNGTKSTFTVKNGSKGSQGEQGIQGVQGPKGDKGDTGPEGPKGDKGDKGDTGATGANGTNGKDGADGEDGATFTPSVDADGNLSWTNNKGLSNPPTVNIKGPKGDSGEGGGGSSSYPVVDIYPYQVDEDGINPNIYYKVIDLAEGEIFYITLNEPTDNSIVNEYVLEFYIIPQNYVGSPSIVLTDTVVWANGKIPPMTGGKTYVVSIVNNLAVFAEF